MTTAERIYQESAKLPESMRNEVLAYIEGLKKQLTKSSVTAEKQCNLADKKDDMTTQSIDLSQLTEKQRKLYEIMNRMSKRPHAYQGIDVMAWQKEQRTDKVLAFRDE